MGGVVDIAIGLVPRSILVPVAALKSTAGSIEYFTHPNQQSLGYSSQFYRLPVLDHQRTRSRHRVPTVPSYNTGDGT